MKISLDKKILAGFLGCSICLIIVAVLSFKNSREFLETNQWVNHTHRVLHEFERVLLYSIDAESGVRGYVISGDENFLEFYEASRDGMYAHLANAKSLTKENPTHQDAIAKLEKSLAARIANLDSGIDLTRQGNITEAQAFVSSGQGRTLQDEIRSLINNVNDSEQTVLAARSEESQSSADTFNKVFIAFLAIITVVLGFVYVLITVNLNALRKAEATANEKNWNLSGTAELTRRMQGNKTIRELGQEIINLLTEYLEIPAGALYVRERTGHALRLQGACAINTSTAFEELVAPGSGIVGQAAAENKVVAITNVEPGAFNIVSTFGSITPASIMAIPFSFENKVAGVIELGSLTSFTPQQQQFIETVSDSIAICIASAQAREEVNDLLEETQRQAEELEAQQHELRQINEELHTKTDLLERSEATLKVQQEELEQANSELEEKANMLEVQKQRLEEAKDEIERKAAQVELSSKYKSEFLANMSHELRTPLNSILILSRILSENKHGRLSEKEVEHSRSIHSSGNDLLNLINEILDLSKIEAGKMVLDVEEFTLGEIISSINNTFTEVGREIGINFEITCDNDSVGLNSDRQRIEQILKNLLSNAFKFTGKQGHVALAINERENGLISFAVSDTGIGIPEDKQRIIFEAFQQADGSTKRKYGGTGLGLSISRELANLLGGWIELKSKEGKGSTFTLVVPAAFDESKTETFPVEIKSEIKPKKKSTDHTNQIALPESDNGSEVPEHNDDRENISENDRVALIIEDDEAFAQSLLEFVRGRNYKGIIATRGTAGISYARDYNPDAILLDMKLPAMDGNEVLVHLKSDPGLRHIPVQIISGYDHQKTSLALGAFDYLKKPVDVPDLHKAFDRIEEFTNRRFRKLLIIEDDKQQNNAIKELVGNGDVKSFSAFSGGEALQLLTKENFDCIIVDLGLPDMSGFDLLEKIKRDDRLNTIPMIVYTGRDLSKEERLRLNKLSDTVVLKTANSYERLLDETTLFLHRVESRLPKEKQMMIRKLHRSDEVLKDKVVLLVDDDIRNIYALTNALEEEGLKCVTAENGKIAVEILNADPRIELVLMDVMMPEMDGYEATIEIRKHEKFERLPIIALTAKAMKGDKEKCLAVGMSDYISKPVNVDQLLSLMRVWLYK